MTKLSINTLQLNLQNAAGHEHRVSAIARRATTLFAEQVSRRVSAGTSRAESVRLQCLSAVPLQVELGSMSNEQAATALDGAWLQAVSLTLKF